MTKQRASSQPRKGAAKSQKELSSSESESAVAVGEQVDQPSVTIDGQQYTLESLGQQGREQLQNLRVVNLEIQRLQDLLAITQTARNTYARALTEVTKNVTPVK